MTQAEVAPRRLWRVRADPASTAAGPWPALVGRLLAYRGLRTHGEAQAFFDAAAPAVLALPDLDLAVRRLVLACEGGETVAIFGDFDVDGITATALLTEGFQALGARPIPYLPHRVHEGYGLSRSAVESLADMGATLLVTADCGTSSVEEVSLARSRAMDVLVLDHHMVPDLLPGANAIVNPKRRPGGDEPAACGIAYYVLRALHQALGREIDANATLELVALGTVCDLAPLVGENRRLVLTGLGALAKTQRPGLRALIEVSGCNPARLDTQAIGFSLGPRINAAGRLAHARVAYDLLTTRDEDEARRLAGELDALNRERQQATEAAMALAEELLADEGEVPLVMVGHEELSAGIVGLVAARLCESRHRPAVVYQRGESESRASCRSIPGFDVTGALRSCGELFVRFGGHRAAAGFTAENEKLPAIKERLLSHAAERLAGEDLSPAITIDAELPLASLRGEEIRWLGRMAPHGVGNPEPAFLSRNVLVVERKAVGADGQHLRLKLRDGNIAWPAIAFRTDGDGIEEGARVDIVYSLSADRMISDGLELRVIDVRAAENLV